MAKKTAVEKAKGATEAAVEANGKSGGRSTWSGALLVGPISIPVAMFTAARGERISFNMLHSQCRSKVKQSGYYCPCCVEVEVLKDFRYQPSSDLELYNAAVEERARKIEQLKKGEKGPAPIPDVQFIHCAKGEKIIMHQDDANTFALSINVKPTGQKAMLEDEGSIIKGYEITKNSFVVVSKEEIDAQKPDSNSIIQIDKFVPLAQVNPIYFEASYYLAADEAVKNKSYSVLREGLVQRKVAAVGKVTMRQYENVVFILAHPDGGMIAYTAYLSDEIKQIRFQQPAAVSDAEREAVCGFIDAMTDDLNMSEYKDAYRENLMAMIAAKQEHRELPQLIAKPKPVQSDNLLEMLQTSTALAKKKKTAA